MKFRKVERLYNGEKNSVGQDKPVKKTTKRSHSSASWSEGCETILTENDDLHVSKTNATAGS